MKLRLIMFTLLILMVNSIAGASIAAAVDVSPIYGAIGMCVMSVVVGNVIPSGALGSGIYAEVWTGYMTKAFRNSIESVGWLNKIRSFDQYVNSNAIHYINLLGDPEVLVNHSGDVPTQSISDSDTVITLDRFDTKATAITDAELHAISYDKISSVIERHKETLLEKVVSKALHSIAPSGNSANTPVLLTTGEARAEGARKMISRNDIIALKRKFDAMKVPNVGRVLVLCTDHVADLLLSDQKFADQYYKYTTGQISNLYGFEVYEYADCPYFKIATKAKINWNAAVAATESQASVAFYVPRMMRASGDLIPYTSLSSNEPVTRTTTIGFRQYFVCQPLKNEAIAAIISDVV